MVKWIKGTDKEVALEYQLEWVNKRLSRMFGDVFPTKEDFIKAYKNAELVTIDKATDRKISYRSRTSSKAGLRSLISSYRSWPEFRNDATLDRLYDGVENGAKIQAPIILKKNGAMRIFGGNTRADVAMQIHGSYQAVVIDVGDV